MPLFSSVVVGETGGGDVAVGGDVDDVVVSIVEVVDFGKDVVDETNVVDSITSSKYTVINLITHKNSDHSNSNHLKFKTTLNSEEEDVIRYQHFHTPRLESIQLSVSGCHGNKHIFQDILLYFKRYELI